MERKKRGERSGERERDREGGAREWDMGIVWVREIDGGWSGWEKEEDC